MRPSLHQSLRVVALPLLLSGSLALAEVPSMGAVVRIDGGDVFFDSGGRAIEPGESVRVFRTVEARRPGDGAVLRDRFLIGEMTVAESGGVLALARPKTGLYTVLSVGDDVELPSETEIQIPDDLPETRVERAAPFLQPIVIAAPPVVCEEKPAKIDPDVELLRSAFDSAANAKPASRAQVWSKLANQFAAVDLQRLATREASFWQAQLEREAARARGEEELRAALEDANRPKKKPSPEVHASVSPVAAWDGTIEILVTSPEGSRIRSAAASVRKQGATTFEVTQLTKEHDGVLRARVPAVTLGVGEHGVVVEVVDDEGDVRQVVGRFEAPATITIESPPPDRIHETGRSRVSMRADLADFSNLSSAFQPDRFLVTELDVLYRLRSTLYSIRMGYGVYAGQGMALALYDDPSARARSLGFNYGYTEFEFRLHESFAVMVRPVIGITDRGIAPGLDLRARIGREDGTSLTLGGQTLGTAGNSVGQAANMKLAWNVIPKFPMAGEVIVTNQPLSDAVGVRLVYEVGTKITDWWSIGLRAGYSLRRVGHAGFGLGAGMTFDW